VILMLHFLRKAVRHISCVTKKTKNYHLRSVSKTKNFAASEAIQNKNYSRACWHLACA
jgi:hypothetical protein